MTKERALKIWEKHYKNQIIVTDFTERKMNKNYYGDSNNLKCGWSIDHAVPIDQQGKNEDFNLLPVNVVTNSEKGERIVFESNNKKYKIVSFKTLRSKYNIDEYQGKGYAYIECLRDGSEKTRATTKS